MMKYFLQFVFSKTINKVLIAAIPFEIFVSLSTILLKYFSISTLFMSNLSITFFKNKLEMKRKLLKVIFFIYKKDLPR